MEPKKDLSGKWESILNILSDEFNKGDDLDIESVIYLIGVQEFGNPNMKFNKDQKIDLMHIAICRLLEPYGFYEFDYVDKDGWPHYKTLCELPHLKPGEQSVLMKEAIVNYFVKTAYIR